jgi:hypothetical protein
MHCDLPINRGLLLSARLADALCELGWLLNLLKRDLTSGQQRALAQSTERASLSLCTGVFRLQISET